MASSGFAPHTLGALMEERFEVYKREAVTRFYEDHFRHYGRQIVLVDVLRALLAGRDAFEDTRLALDAILDSFRYGHGGIITKLLFGSHIDRVLFAATKADHVPDIQRDHLAALLRNMAAFPALDVISSNARMEVTALASVISTAEDSQEIDGHRVQVVVGRPVGSAKQAKFFVGNVPIRPPRPDSLGLAVPQRAGVRAARRRSVAGRGHTAHQSRPGARIPAGRPAAMSDQSSVPRNAPQSPRVIEVEPAEELARLRVEPAPQIIATERTERIVPSEPANLPAVAGAPVRRRDRVVTLALPGWRCPSSAGLRSTPSAGFPARSSAAPSLGLLAATAVAGRRGRRRRGDRARADEPVPPQERRGDPPALRRRPRPATPGRRPPGDRRRARRSAARARDRGRDRGVPAAGRSCITAPASRSSCSRGR